jgi:hypothetical protein
MGFSLQETMLICEILILYSKTSSSSFHTLLQAVVSYKILFTSIWSILRIISPPKIECYALSKSFELYEKNNTILTLKIKSIRVVHQTNDNFFFIIQVHTENGMCKHSIFIELLYGCSVFRLFWVHYNTFLSEK